VPHPAIVPESSDRVRSLSLTVKGPVFIVCAPITILGAHTSPEPTTHGEKVTGNSSSTFPVIATRCSCGVVNTIWAERQDG
jgi:hypothetical protein